MKNQANKHGLPLYEDTITQLILLELATKHYEQIKVQIFSRGEEAQNGADWEWLIIDGKNSIQMRIQAKSLYRNGNYVALNTEQSKKLLEKRDQHISPFFVFYNCDYGSLIFRNNKPTIEEYIKFVMQKMYNNIIYNQDWGCCIAPADAVVKAGSNSLANLVSLMFPWHKIFDPGTDFIENIKANLKISSEISERPSYLHESKTEFNSEASDYLKGKDLSGLLIIEKIREKPS